MYSGISAIPLSFGSLRFIRKNSLKMATPPVQTVVFSLGESGLGDFFNQSLEFRGFADSQIGENLAVQFDIGFLETVHKRAVIDVQSAACSVDTDDPETAVLLFFLLTALVSVNTGVIDCVVDCTDVLAGIAAGR